MTRDRKEPSAQVLSPDVVDARINVQLEMGTGGWATLHLSLDEDRNLAISLSYVLPVTLADGNTCINYAADGSIVEMVILEASQQGAWPLRQAA